MRSEAATVFGGSAASAVQWSGVRVRVQIEVEPPNSTTFDPRQMIG